MDTVRWFILATVVGILLAAPFDVQAQGFARLARAAGAPAARTTSV